MGRTIKVDGDHWRQEDDGSWFKWNAARASWEPSTSPPAGSGQASLPPPPPPPDRSPGAPTAAAVDQGTGTGSPPLPRPPGASLSASRDVTPTDTRSGRDLSRLLLAAAVGGSVLVLAVLAFIFVLGGDDGPPPRPDPPPATSPPPVLTAAISPYNERTIYQMGERLQDCFGPETVAWAGEMGADVVDQPGLKDDVRRISANVEELRQHRFREQVDVEFVPRDRIGKEALELSAGGFTSPDARLDEKILRSLGILPDGASLRKLTRKVISGEVAGFYVPATKKLLAGRGDGGLGPLDEIIVAHELDHALTDAAVGLPPLDDLDPMETDRMLAHRAVVEGDATLAMVHYAVASFEPSEWQTFLSDPAAAGSLDTEGLPDFLRKAFSFPYTEGMLFACDQFSRGGWAGVDRSLQEPPVSSAQVLFPDRYLKQVPVVDASDPATPQGWEHVRSGAFGAADLLWLTQEAWDVPADQTGAGIANVRGWAGGELHAFERAGNIALTITLVDGGYETKRGDVLYELCDTLGDVYQRRIEGALPFSSDGLEIWRSKEGFGAVSCSKQMARLAIASDRATVEALAPIE